MSDALEQSLAATIRAAAHPIGRGADDLEPLIARSRGARLVLLGEATHGTHEFYRIRAELTKRLIEEHGFAGLAVEADWPDAYRVNRWIQGASGDRTAEQALAGFTRFPRWMWRNADVLDLVGWLRAYNEGLAPGRAPVGFYGIDLYSLYASIEAVIEYLERVAPHAALRARARYACFDHFDQDSQAYGYSASLGITPTCEDEVVRQLVELRRQASELRESGEAADDEFFYAEQNARLVKNAEEYYRTMFRGRVSAWNLRDRHMAETLEALLRHLAKRDGEARLVIWAHNSHLGDARATEMSRRGEWNVGQLVRERFGQDALLVGFTTATGTVTAAADWDAPAERKRVRPPLPESYEALFHEQEIGDFMLLMDTPALADLLRAPRLQRAIGVIYRPRTERASHYFLASLSEQFDAVLHLDRTRAVEPLDDAADWAAEEAPDTYPFAV